MKGLLSFIVNYSTAEDDWDFSYIEIKITNVKKTKFLIDWFNIADQVNYTIIEKITYVETKKKVFKEFVKLMKSDIFKFTDYNVIKNIDSNELALGLVEEFMSLDTKNLYPEIFI